MGALFELVRKLVLVVIFAGFCELLLPRGSFRSYLRLVVGLVVIALLLQPLAQFRGGVNWEGALQAGADEELAVPDVNWHVEATRLVEEQLAAKAKGVLAPHYPDANIEVELDLEYDSRGNLQTFSGMAIYVTPRQPEGIRPVEPVKVGGGHLPAFQELDDPALTAALAEQLGLAPESVSIMIWREGGADD